MNLKFQIAMFTLCFGVLNQQAVAQEAANGEQLGTSDAPLAVQGEAVLTQAEIDAAFNKVSPEVRLPYIRGGDRVDRLVRTMLSNRILANEARKAGYDQVPVISHRQILAAEKELADAWMEKVMLDAPVVNFETIAYETYLAKPEIWITEDRVDVSHILISSETRSPEEALELALSIRKQIIEDPAAFEALVMEYSEDPSKEINEGRFADVKRGDMVQPFEDASFAMENEGEISQPVETPYGYHIIRLNQSMPGAVPPFEEVKAQIVEQARTQYMKEYRTNYLKNLLSTPVEFPEGAIEDMVQRYFGKDLELAPEYPE